MANILIIDDDLNMSYTLTTLVQRMKHDVTAAYRLVEGLQAAREHEFDVVLLDVWLPDGNGLDALQAFRESPGRPEVIIITGSGDTNGAELAIANGAWDYIEKPSSLQAMTLPLLRALQYRQEKKNNTFPPIVLNRERVIGDSIAIRDCLDLVAKASIGDATVLITGETGTGKELFARTIHENSRRRKGNFVVVDCASLPESLVASILFGFEKGAFSGADKASDGLLLQADGGTLFLDEVGEMPLSLQKAFLRITQEGRFRPVGSKTEKTSDFRVIAATNRNLEDTVRTGQFRSDLFFRLRTLSIHLPSLRERKDDIKILAHYYMNKLCERHGVATKGFSPDFFGALNQHAWPGNIRELFNTLETTFLSAYYDPTLFPKHLPVTLRIQLTKAALGTLPKCHILEPPDDLNLDQTPTLREFRRKAITTAEKRYLDRLMIKTGFDVSQACRLSGLARARMYELLNKYKIDKES